MNVSTLFYVLDDLDSKNDVLINLEEIYELEHKYFHGIFGKIDRLGFEVNPGVIQNILQVSSTD
ncbi:hypothetical protein ACFLSP_01470 [Bacteroidota bacterium]